MEQAAEAEEYERAAKYRDLISTVEQLQEKQRIAAAEGDDADVFGYHYENGMLAVNLFHMRGGRVVDRREFFWEDLPEFAGRPRSGECPQPPSPSKARCRCNRGHLASAANGLPRIASNGSISSRRILLCVPEAALHRPALRSAEYLRAGRFRRSRGAGRLAL